MSWINVKSPAHRQAPRRKSRGFCTAIQSLTAGAGDMTHTASYYLLDDLVEGAMTPKLTKITKMLESLDKTVINRDKEVSPNGHSPAQLRAWRQELTVLLIAERLTSRKRWMGTGSVSSDLDLVKQEQAAYLREAVAKANVKIIKKRLLPDQEPTVWNPSSKN